MVSVSCRPVEAAAAVLDIVSPAQCTMDAGDALARLQGYDTLAIRHRFRELSIVVHPDKCMLPGARQVRMNMQIKPHASMLYMRTIDFLGPFVCQCLCSVRLTC